jgi:uncharacterized protein affecting Mg2+/Co2+ transport
MLENKYRFSYRIRVENISPDPEAYVQLLGRHWNVQELEDGESVSLSATENDTDGVGLFYRRKPVIVDAPYTGAGE